MKTTKDSINNLMQSHVVSSSQGKVPEFSNGLISADYSDPYIFIQNVSKFLIKVNNKKESVKQDCFFILVPNHLKRDVENHGKGIKRFFSISDIDMHGKIILSMDLTLSNVRYLDLLGEQVTSQIDLHNSFFTEIENTFSSDFSSLCYCKYESGNMNLTCYPEGDEKEELVYNLNKEKIVFDSSKLESHADEFFLKELKYPTSKMMIWDNQKKLELMQKAESRISVRLTDSFIQKLGVENVILEPTVISGRVDILIHSSALVEGFGPCILELKVLRHQQTSSYNKRWLYKGILQARDYGNTMQAKSRYLFSYDGRSKLEEYEVINKLATKYSVKHINYFMLNKVDQERDAEVNDALDK